MLVDITWTQFKRIQHISRLPLNEQVREYEGYCHWYQMNYTIMCDNGGKSATKLTTQPGFLQQENFFYILQEDGSYITIT